MSLRLPDREQILHPWYSGDTMTYVEPARAFLETGVFARDGQPDMHRSIGYPFFLAAMMRLFGSHWILAVFVVQTAVFASLFPPVTIIARLWFPEQSKVFKVTFVTLIVNGIGLAYVGQLLTDQLFAVCLVVGLALGLLAIVRSSWKFAILHVVVIGYAAQIRPVLGIYCFANLFFQWFTAKAWEKDKQKKVRLIIVSVALLIAVVGNGPAIRNFLNYGVFTPTDVLSDNLSRYLAGPVLIHVGKTAVYEERLRIFKQLGNIEKITIQKQFALETIKNYPGAALFVVGYHAVWNLFEPHWEYLLWVFGHGFNLNSMFDHSGQLKSGLFWGIPFFVTYLLIYFLFISSCLRMAHARNWLLLLGMFFFLMPLAASFINGQGARMRLFAEPVILVFAVVELCRLLPRLRMCNGR